jgi:hypothetical protein
VAMANSLIFPNACSVGECKIPNEIFTKIKYLIERFAQITKGLIEQKGLKFRTFSLFKPANIFIAIDDEKIVFVRNCENVSITMPRFDHFSWIGQGTVSIEYIHQLLTKELGYVEMNTITFEKKYLDLPEEQMESLLKIEAEGMFSKEYKEYMQKHQPAILSLQEITQFLDQASEDDFTLLFLIPLFRKMGFEKVLAKMHEERILEFGQDIKLMKYRLPTGHYLYFVSQIKVGKIGASSKQPTQEIESILTEIRPAFRKEIFDPDINRKMKPDHVFFITSGKIGEQAKDYLYEQIDSTADRNIKLLEREVLIDLYFKYGLPEKEQNLIKTYGKS